ncbi:MAG: UDP-N-acetylmuramoyl-L-alanyl-D-glutamate--2,6-diaminopimelate ligase [Dongiaceae bacterium]
MRLSQLIEGDNIDVYGQAAPAEIEIRGITADSRMVEPGWLFAALPGARADGREFVAAAVKRGASAALVPADTKIPELDRPIAILRDANPRRRLALMAARFHGLQPRVIAAVTGTNGKTSTAEFTRQLWARLGHRAASLGTLGVFTPEWTIQGSLTTPDPVALHRQLADLVRGNIDHLAMEASSHGLDQFRLDGVKVSVAGFTNLSRDHLDYHATMAAYLAAKRRLFQELLVDNGAAVLNADVAEFDDLAAICRTRRLRVLSYGRKGKDICLERATPGSSGQELVITLDGRRYALTFPVAGEFQAMNLLCALGLVIGSGEDPDRTLGAVSRLKGVRGRIEPAARRSNGATVYVDYAHTPDALATVLTALRPHARGRLVVVFGCGGDRDRGKRPQMGAVAEQLADLVIVTDDNPRGEQPAAIRAEILAACRRAREIGDRAAAIKAAIEQLAADDLLVIAGKGHESGQIIAGETLPFDDAEVARAAVAALEGHAP